MDLLTQALVNDLWAVCIGPGIANRPSEIHFCLRGGPGGFVDINAFGSRSHGLFKTLLDTNAANATNLAGNTWLVPIVEHRVVVGTFIESINPPANGLNWTPLGQNKSMKKLRLIHLIDRCAHRNNFLAANPAANPAAQPWARSSQVSASHAPMDDELDEFLEMMTNEWQFRGK